GPFGLGPCEAVAHQSLRAGTVLGADGLVIGARHDVETVDVAIGGVWLAGLALGAVDGPAEVLEVARIDVHHPVVDGETIPGAYRVEHRATGLATCADMAPTGTGLWVPKGESYRVVVIYPLAGFYRQEEFVLSL